MAEQRIHSFRAATKAAVTILFFLAGVAAGAKDITIAWDPNTEPDLAGYKVHFRESGQPFETISVSEAEATLTDLASGKTYEFFVTAINTSGVESAPSETISHSIPEEPILSTPDQDGSDTEDTESSTPIENPLVSVSKPLTIAWDANTEPDLAGYNVYFGEVQQEKQKLSVSTPQATLEGLLAAHTYEIYVTAVNTAGVESAPSEIIVYTVDAAVQEPVLAEVVISGLSHLYDGSGKSVNVTTTPEGLSVELAYNGSTALPVDAGVYQVSATVTEAGYEGSGTATMEIQKAPVQIAFDVLIQTFDGKAKFVLTETVPSSVRINVTYSGSSNPPVEAGAYDVHATVDDPNYTGSATGVLEILPAPATVSLSGLNHTYDAKGKAATITTVPAGLNVEVRYNGQSAAPVDAGVYDVVATINDPNYSGTATGTLEIEKAPGYISFEQLDFIFDGSPKTPIVITEPAGLKVQLTYDGQATTPTGAGRYSVAASIEDKNYSGTANSILTIGQAEALIQISDLHKTYDGSIKTVSVIMEPPGLEVEIAYNGRSTAPVNAGSYEVSATVNDPNYTGIASGTMQIEQAAAVVTLGNLVQVFDGHAKSITATTTPAGLAIEIEYAGGEIPVNAGEYAFTATITDSNYTGSASGTLTIANGLNAMLPNTPVTFTIGTEPVLISSGAIIGDAAGINVSSLQLTAAITTNAAPEDYVFVIEFAGHPEFVVENDRITLNGREIALWAGGSDGEPLQVTFSAAAVPTDVQTVIRALVFYTTSEKDLDRQVEISLSGPSFMEPIAANVDVAINFSPTTTEQLSHTAQGVDASVLLADLLGTASDADGDELTITVVLPSENGTVSKDSNSVIFQPAAGYSGTEIIRYCVEDEMGGMVWGEWHIQVTAPVRIEARKVRQSDSVAAGGMKLSFAGVAGQVFKVHASTDLKEWTLIGRATVGDNGMLEFVDGEMNQHGHRFYRTELEP